MTTLHEDLQLLLHICTTAFVLSCGAIVKIQTVAGAPYTDWSKCVSADTLYAHFLSFFHNHFIEMGLTRQSVMMMDLYLIHNFTIKKSHQILKINEHIDELINNDNLSVLKFHLPWLVFSNQ
jgi:hypothetical protein